MPLNTSLRHTPDDKLETPFREDVRNALDLDMFTRDFQIIAEIKRLKAVEKAATEAHEIVTNIIDTMKA